MDDSGGGSSGFTEEEMQVLLAAAQGRSLTNSADGGGPGGGGGGGDGDAPSLTINLNEHEDGERSANKGPCPCGYKHYLEGKEHDWVFKIPTLKGNKLLGYSLGENPYIAAKTFVDKHQIAQGNEREYIDHVAQLIISSTASATPAGGAAASTSVYNPYLALPEPPKSAASAATATPSAPADPAAEAKRRKEIEDAQNRLRAEKLRQEQEKEKIKERIRLDRENRKKEEESKRKLEEARRLSDAGHTPAVPRPSLISPAPSASSVVGGSSTNNSSSDLQDMHHQGTATGSQSTLGVPSPRNSQPSAPNFPSLSNPLNNQHQQQRLSGGSTNNQIGGISRFGSDSDEIGDAGPLKPKEEWTLQDLQTYLRLEGEAGLMARLVSAKFTETEIIKFFNLAVRMKQLGSGEDMMNAIGNTMPSGMQQKIPSPQQQIAFQGGGYRLGGSDSPAPAAPSSTSSLGSSAAGPVSFANVVATGSAVPPQDISVDDSKPKTQISIRLADGQRLVATFNHTHTIADIRQHLNVVRPNACRGEYELIVQHPRKVLSDLAISIEAAGLLKGVIIQTPK